MRLIFHGVLETKFGSHFDIFADSISEAIEGFSRQVDWPKDLVFEVAGHRTVESLLDCPKEVHILPALRGGSGKFFNILVGVAMIGLAFATGGATLAGGLLTTTSSLGAALLVGGALMVLQGVVMLFMKAPKYSKSLDPEASKYVTVNRNTTAIGTPVTLAWGTIDLAGQWLSLQSDSNQLSYGVFPTNPT